MGVGDEYGAKPVDVVQRKHILHQLAIRDIAATDVFQQGWTRHMGVEENLVPAVVEQERCRAKECNFHTITPPA
jgi:hypothetical protein